MPETLLHPNQPPPTHPKGADMKTFNCMSNVGRARHVVNHHDGVKQHKDGSPFFDIAIFGNERKKKAFVSDLKKQGYTERGY